jgi:hypothetical protein
LGGGFVLTFGGCLLAIYNGTTNDVTVPFVFFAVVFFVGALMMLAGVAATVVKLIIVIFRKR